MYVGAASGTTVGGRRVLPVTRRSVTHKFALGGFEGYLTVGLFEDDVPGEIFIKMSKEGSTLSGLIQGFCQAFSLAPFLAGRGGRRFDLAPDGERFIIRKPGGGTQAAGDDPFNGVIIIENWFQELTERVPVP